MSGPRASRHLRGGLARAASRSALALLALAATSCTLVAQRRVVHDGFVDLSEWDPVGDGPVQLDGQWAFYWERFVDPADAEALARPSGFIRVPSPWNGAEIGGERLPGLGYGTYRLVVRLPEGHPPLALDVRGLGSAYRLFADQEVVASVGEISDGPGRGRPGLGPRIVPVESGAQLDLVIQVSNFEYAKGGAGGPIVLGEREGVRRRREDTLRFQGFLAGAMVIMALYHLSLFAARRRDRSSLYFAGLCLAMVARVYATDQKVLAMQFPDLPFAWVPKVEYGTMFVIGACLTSFTVVLFRGEMSRIGYWLLQGTAAAFFLLVATTPPIVFSAWLPLMQVYLVAGSLYVVFVVLRATARGREGAAFFALALVFLALTIFHDIFVSLRWISTPVFLVPVGVVLFTFMQALVLSRRFSLTLRRVEEASLELSRAHAELNEYSAGLEARVAERTEELARVNRELSLAVARDGLTGVANRRYLDDSLPRLWADHARRGASLSVVMCDVDHFKQFNDAYGHPAGDEALRSVAAALREVARRPLDVVARYGGEEFAIVLSDTALPEATTLAEAVRSSIARRAIAHAAAPGGRLTVSLGVASRLATREGDPAALVSNADAALYEAKRAGRDRVVAADRPGADPP